MALPLFVAGNASILKSKLQHKLTGSPQLNDVHIGGMAADLLYEITRNYLTELISRAAPTKDFILLNNALEPFHTDRRVQFIENVKLLVIDRDPRDIYISALLASGATSDFVGRPVIGGGVEKFVSRFLKQRVISSHNSRSRLDLMFENFFEKSEFTFSRISDFLALDIDPGQFPGLKKQKNVALYKDNLLLLYELKVI